MVCHRLEDLPHSISFSNTPDGLPLLLVNFKARFMVISQRRLDYYQENSMWTPIAAYNLNSSPFPLASASVGYGGSVMAAIGNQLHLFSRNYTGRRTSPADMFTSIREANSALPDYHPQLLVQCLLAGKFLLCGG
jgi:hypothetical protein